MNPAMAGKQDDAHAALRAEAAAWLARLHGPNRTQDVEAGFRAWMNESPDHAAAFEHMTDTWEKAARLRRRPTEYLASWEWPGIRVSFSRAVMAAAAVAVVTIIGTILYLHNDAIATSIGEQRILTLEEGSRVYLNTDTQVKVHYDKSVRRVELEKGEALFEVAKRPDWPFIVTAGDRQIRALGTSFIVRREEHDLAVTLVEGKVTVSPAIAEEDRRTPAAAPLVKGDVYTLTPGQRLTFHSHAPRVDHPALDKLTAWQRGQVVLDNQLLEDSAAEMNRYSRTKLVVQSSRAAEIHISGIFRSGDSLNFAMAISKTYGLEVIDTPGEIILADPQSSAIGSNL